MAFLMGNQKVGSAKVYETTKEYEQEQKIKELKELIKKQHEIIEFYGDTINYDPIQMSPNPDCSGLLYLNDEGDRARKHLEENKDFYRRESTVENI